MLRLLRFSHTAAVGMISIHSCYWRETPQSPQLTLPILFCCHEAAALKIATRLYCAWFIARCLHIYSMTTVQGEIPDKMKEVSRRPLNNLSFCNKLDLHTWCWLYHLNLLPVIINISCYFAIIDQGASLGYRHSCWNLQMYCHRERQLYAA